MKEIQSGMKEMISRSNFSDARYLVALMLGNQSIARLSSERKNRYSYRGTIIVLRYLHIIIQVIHSNGRPKRSVAPLAKCDTYTS